LVNRKQLLLYACAMTLALISFVYPDSGPSPLTPLIFSMAFRPFDGGLPWKDRPKSLRVAEVLRLALTFGLMVFVLVRAWPWYD
jgi:hypothetical protein